MRERQPVVHKMGVMAKRKKENEILKSMFNGEVNDDFAYLQLLAGVKIERSKSSKASSSKKDGRDDGSDLDYESESEEEDGEVDGTR